MTTKWYHEVLERIDPNSSILDIGIGEGQAVINNREVLSRKCLHLHGIDYDKDYVDSCNKLIVNSSMASYITVSYQSIYDYNPQTKFDCAYFSGSFMILPQPEEALNRVCNFLKNSESRIYFTQTIESKKNWLLESIKPLLKYLLTIDFGHVTYESEFIELLERCNLQIIEHTSIRGTAAKITVVSRSNRKANMISYQSSSHESI
jgi:ubiquinone/menaquinone biosynthesis C-methylase UbiE